MMNVMKNGETMNALEQYINAKQRALILLREAELNLRHDRVEEVSRLLWALLDQLSELSSLLEQAKREVL